MIGGVITSTFLTLLVIPTFYEILDEWRSGFEAWAERTPDAPVLLFAGTALTYRELNERANRLAHYLRRRGVGPEVRVGICLERGLEMVVSILAVLKAGGAYVPLDPAYPADRLAFTLSDAGVPVVLAQEKVRATLTVPDGVELVSLDAARAEIAAESAENPAGGATPGSLAYVIYTSGSTGQPKGVEITHRSLLNCLLGARDALVGDDRLLAFLGAVQLRLVRVAHLQRVALGRGPFAPVGRGRYATPTSTLPGSGRSRRRAVRPAARGRRSCA